MMMASTTSALSLANFERITATTIHLGCILAYNYQIPGCTIADFSVGNTCSAACVKGLTRIQYTVQEACPNINVDASSVLGQVLLGNLVELLCPDTSSDTPTSTSTSSIRSTPSRTTFVIITPTSSRPVPALTPVRPTSTTTTFTRTAETEDSQTSISETQTEEAETFTSSPTTSASPLSSSPSSSTAGAAPEPTAEDSSGGGSPFDVATSDSRQLTVFWTQTVAAVLGLGLLLLH
ncbi:hypothetical protein N658DRAFT_502825 [Parathielavia hyrcaniae]|uniref:Uncharacterized protein n=1 Tax=Parathielavia hyrcaniae TaxID=113614 RepID=A0AAN6T691_9PEZI|nr:hypothetical protein N658DRAFT_502825 [Parathielavia hyrcaniae]